MPITEIECRVCTASVWVGLPKNYAALEVSAEPDPSKPEDAVHHTRHVHCPRGHSVYFYFERAYGSDSEE